ncbi:MAG: nucleotidyltransferase [Spirochaetes bacterium]|nr:nucleotidyltransferase [Spirochaetota bacterium]
MDKGRYNITTIKKAIAILTRIFNSINIPFALIGGISLESWGLSRATYDIDFLIIVENHQLQILKDKLKKNKFEPIKTSGLEKWMLRFLFNGIQIDILMAMDDLTKNALKRRVLKECIGIKTYIASVEDLILLKLRLSRPRDIDDVISLINFNKNTIDREYLKRWVKKLLLTGEWELLKKILE